MAKRTLHKYKLKEPDTAISKQRNYFIIDSKAMIVLALLSIVISLVLILGTIAFFETMI